MQMKKEFPNEYNFFPLTFLLPYEMYEFRKQFLTKEELEEQEKHKKNKGQKQPEKKK